MARELSRCCRMARRSEVVAPRWCKVFTPHATRLTLNMHHSNKEHTNTFKYIVIVSRARCPSCVEPTRFTRARHLSRPRARGSIAAGSRPSWSRSRLTTSNQPVRGGSKSRIAREGWCGGKRSTFKYTRIYTCRLYELWQSCLITP